MSSKGPKKTRAAKAAKSKTALSESSKTQTAKRHTTVPAAATGIASAAGAAVAALAPVEAVPSTAVASNVVVTVETPAEPTLSGAAVAELTNAVVTPIDVVPTTEVVAEVAAEVAVVETAAIARIEPEATPAVDGQVIIGLIRDLRHEDADVAREAAESLGTTGDAAAVEALIEVLENGNGFFHSIVRSTAASSLAKLGDRRAVASLLQAVNDEMAETSAQAIRALGDLGDARAVETLIGVARNYDGYFVPAVRLAALNALSRFHTEEAANELARVAADRNEDLVICQAATGVASW